MSIVKRVQKMVVISNGILRCFPLCCGVTLDCCTPARTNGRGVTHVPQRYENDTSVDPHFGVILLQTIPLGHFVMSSVCSLRIPPDTTAEIDMERMPPQVRPIVCPRTKSRFIVTKGKQNGQLPLMRAKLFTAFVVMRLGPIVRPN